MINESDTKISQVLPIFSSLGLQATFIVPTKTAIEKSIIDATHSTREYLLRKNIHDYRMQDQGQENKAIVDTYFVGESDLRKTQTSLYRPPTKEGDPRMWFYRLKNYAIAYNLLAIIAQKGEIYVINCSDDKILRSLESGKNPLFSSLNINNNGLTNEANELLDLLCAIGRRGWTKTLRRGDGGVGFTLESLLGISANSSRAPDYKGVEIKSSRSRSLNQTLFAKTPDWKKSRLKSSLDILEERGRFSDKKNRIQLFHSIFANKKNSYDLQLEVSAEDNYLRQYCNLTDRREDDVLWEISVLQDALRNKHRQTFWIKSKTRIDDGIEKFLYYEGEYTREPNVELMPLLLEAGEIFVDYTIKQNPNGSAKDQGYLFRMKKNNLTSLFGEAKTFQFL